MAVAVPIEDRFAETGSRGDDSDVVLRVIHTAIEIEKIPSRKFLQAARGGDEIVHEDDALARKIETSSERCSVENPGNVRGVKTAVNDGAGNAETGGDHSAIRNGRQGLLCEGFDQVFETGEIAGGIALFGNQFERTTVIEIGREIAFCSADVA